MYARFWYAAPSYAENIIPDPSPLKDVVGAATVPLCCRKEMFPACPDNTVRIIADGFETEAVSNVVAGAAVPVAAL